MRLARWAGGLAVLAAGVAHAAPGDALQVSGSNVNVRAGPSTDAGILTQVRRHEPAIEQRRQGQWVEVELPNQNVLGWIHGSLLGPAPAGSAAGTGQGDVAAINVGGTAAAATADAEDSSALGRFRRDVEYFNSRALAVAGVDLFTDVQPLGEGSVQVVTTDAWTTISAPGQQSYLNALFGRWRAAVGGDRALRLEIVDSGGTVMLEKSAP
ncbi:MAG TPA: SH3 domain-containing protein [Geminicoccaceae bacterium]|nr:SH3 domain-containing protein [Geminicoccaceae bacterium]